MWPPAPLKVVMPGSMDISISLRIVSLFSYTFNDFCHIITFSFSLYLHICSNTHSQVHIFAKYVSSHYLHYYTFACNLSEINFHVGTYSYILLLSK